ncbi:MAG: hypothetical protein QWI73_05890 [Alphaproteobacteria bacterium]|nr:hypothetical protein [Alphaproteobacteria bacterium]
MGRVGRTRKPELEKGLDKKGELSYRKKKFFRLGLVGSYGAVAGEQRGRPPGPWRPFHGAGIARGGGGRVRGLIVLVHRPWW